MIDGEPAGDALDARLRRAVAADAGQRAACRQRGDVDDRAAGRVPHRRPQHSDREQRSDEIQVDDVAVGLDRHVERRGVGRHGRRGDVAAGAVDEHVDAAEAREACVPRSLERRRVEDVGSDAECLMPRRLERSRGPLDSLGAAGENDDAGARLGQPRRARAPDCARAAGHDGDTPCERERVGVHGPIMPRRGP